MSDDKLTPLQIETIEKETKMFDCPSCGAHLQFLVRVAVGAVREIDKPEIVKTTKVPPPVKDKLTAPERSLFESLRQTGLYDAFETAAKASLYTNVKDMERYFLTFLQNAVPVKTPQFAIRQCLPDGEADGDLELWQLNTVCAVIANGEVRAFFPVDLIKGRPLRTPLQSNGKSITTIKDNVSLSDWVKTRNGYVSGRGLLFKELRGKAAGAFANTGI